MKKYELQHVYNTEKKEYHNYYNLIDVVNSMNSARFVKNVKHAVALTLYNSKYFNLSNVFDEIRQLSDKEVRNNYYQIKTRNDKSLIGTSVFVFCFKAQGITHYASIQLSVQVINKQLKFVVTYHTSLNKDKEVETPDLDELFNLVNDFENEKIKEKVERRKQLKADLQSLGFYKKYNKKPKHTNHPIPQMMSVNEFENKLNELGDLDKIQSPFEDDWI